MELRKDDLGNTRYKEGLDSLSKNTDAEEVGKWIMSFIKADLNRIKL